METVQPFKSHRISIPGYAELTEEQAAAFIKRMLEYSSLHDLLKKTYLEAHADFIANQPTNETILRIDKHYSEAISSSCAIITDFMLNRCRELMQGNAG